MKLSSEQIAAVESVTGAQPIPEQDPAAAKLREAVGDHTFYVDQQGLLVLESAPEAAAPEETLEIVRVGQWVDDERRQLGLTPPAHTGQVIDLSAPDDDGGAAPEPGPANGHA